MTSYLKWFLGMGSLLLVTAGGALADSSNFETNAAGVLIHLGTAQVELAPFNSNTLLLSVSLDGAPGPIASTFLADTNADSAVPWRVVRRHGMVGIRSACGELLMNPATGEWTLENARGRTLIPRHAIGDLASGDESSVDLTLGWMKRAPLDVYGCGNGVGALEQSNTTTRVSNGLAVIPYYWANAGYAVLAVTADDNRPASWRAAAHDDAVTWKFPGRAANLYLMPAATLADAARDYANLTGHAPVPPRWALGYLQSRWGWADRAYIEDTLAKFRDLKLPVDAFIYDFEWYTPTPDYALPSAGEPDFKDFSWNTNLFPHPAEQIKEYKEQGIHFVGIRKPRMGNAATLKMLREKQWMLQSDRAGFETRDVNFADPEFRQWYISQLEPLLKAGVDGWWNDEGEASYTTYYYWNLTEEEALQRYRPDSRLWTLNRAFSPGLQRLGAAAWTGDIRSAWRVLAATPTALLNWNLAGLPYETCDIGGFLGNPSPELLSRWMEAGVFFPVMRSHSEVHDTPRFPWLYGPDALNAIRDALDLRYRLIPYYYSLAHETFETGLPLMRPLVMEFPRDPKVANLSDEWMMGRSLLAAPVLQPGGKRSVYLPDATWYAFESNVPLPGKRTVTVTAALDEIPLYVRAGSILPLGPVIQHTSELPGGPLELEIYPGKDASFAFYEDDGHSRNYLSGQMRETIFQWNDRAGRLSWTTEGDYAGRHVFKSFRVVVFDRHGQREAAGDLGGSGSVTP